MTPTNLPSVAIPESQKRGFSEADVHSKLFDLDMTQAFGYPSRLTTEADGEHFREQRTLAVRRLKTGAATGRFDGLYLIGEPEGSQRSRTAALRSLPRVRRSQPSSSS